MKMNSFKVMNANSFYQETKISLPGRFFIYVDMFLPTDKASFAV